MTLLGIKFDVIDFLWRNLFTRTSWSVRAFKLFKRNIFVKDVFSLMHIYKRLCIISLWNSPHHGRPKTVENKGSNVRYNRINITFPNWVIVENIIPRNMIISLVCAFVDNHIPRDDISDYQPIRECNIYILLYSSLNKKFISVISLASCNVLGFKLFCNDTITNDRASAVHIYRKTS